MAGRILHLTAGEAVDAHARLASLKQAVDTPTPGRPMPAFNAMLRVASMVRALGPVVRQYRLSEAGLQAEYAMKDAGGQFVVVKDPNGNIQNGAFYIGNAPDFNRRLSELRNGVVECEAGDLGMDDVLEVAQSRIGTDALAELLPILSPDRMEPSADALARWEAVTRSEFGANAAANPPANPPAAMMPPAALPPGSVPQSDPSATAPPHAAQPAP